MSHIKRGYRELYKESSFVFPSPGSSNAGSAKTFSRAQLLGEKIVSLSSDIIRKLAEDSDSIQVT